MGTRHINLAGDVTTNPQFSINTTTGKLSRVNTFFENWKLIPVFGEKIQFRQNFVKDSVYVYTVGYDYLQSKKFVYRAPLADLRAWEECAEVYGSYDEYDTLAICSAGLS